MKLSTIVGQLQEGLGKAIKPRGEPRRKPYDSALAGDTEAEIDREDDGDKDPKSYWNNQDRRGRPGGPKEPF